MGGAARSRAARSSGWFTTTFTSARPAQPVPIPDELGPAVTGALASVGIDQLYAHQSDALYAAFEGPTIVTTGTASGKSLCFQLPTLEVLSRDRTARALYLYPTKALAQDQARALHALRSAQAVRPGDLRRRHAARAERAAIRKRSNLSSPTPTCSTSGSCPTTRPGATCSRTSRSSSSTRRTSTAACSARTSANVLRRLRRVAAIHGTAPRFLLASATIANPVELAERLTGLTDFDADRQRRRARRAARGWRCGTRRCSTRRSGSRRSALYEAAELFAELVARGRADDLLHEVAQGRRADPPPRGSTGSSPSWPSGSPPTAPATRRPQRQEIQRRLSAGELLGVVATDALELGIDIGELDAAICVDVPRHRREPRQMWGRAGRRGRGLAVYIAGEDALDQFFCRHPDEFLERPVEAAILDPDSHEIYAEHLLCAAHEAPLTRRRRARSSAPRWREHAEALGAAGLLRERADRLRARARRRLPGRARLRCARPRPTASR